MKIAVLGKGLAGVFTAQHFKYYNPQLDVEIIYDPNIDPVPIGQATLTETPSYLWRFFEMDWYDNPIGATPKTGILYENWGSIKDKFFHPFPLQVTALHYDTTSVQDYILEHGDFTVTENHVKGYDEVDADYIIDARGFPRDYSEYDDLVNPLNTAILAIKEGQYIPEQLWTRTVATPDGWTFVIPLKNRTSYGYLFNNDLVNSDEAKNTFCEMFGVDDDDIYKEMHFKNYIAKEPVVDDRVALQGNKLFFIEPLESSSIALYHEWTKHLFSWMVLKDRERVDITDAFKKQVIQVQNFILYHYQFGSKWDTEFWRYAKSISDFINNDSEWLSYKQYAINFKLHISTEHICNNKIYGLHNPFSIRNCYEGIESSL
jgi:tryptophan halogenase